MTVMTKSVSPELKGKQRGYKRRVRLLGDVVEEVGFFLPNCIDSLMLLPQQEFSTGQLPSRGLAFNPLQWGLQDRQALSSASCVDMLDTFGENVRCSDWQEGLEQPVGEELARRESDEISGVWWDPMLSISGYTSHMCVS